MRALTCAGCRYIDGWRLIAEATARVTGERSLLLEMNRRHGGGGSELCARSHDAPVATNLISALTRNGEKGNDDDVEEEEEEQEEDARPAHRSL